MDYEPILAKGGGADKKSVVHSVVVSFERDTKGFHLNRLWRRKKYETLVYDNVAAGPREHDPDRMRRCSTDTGYCANGSASCNGSTCCYRSPRGH
jgi:predicted GNAT superfamily acetyltransferase